MGSLGFWEIVFLAVLALMIFGPDRLPGIARNVGRTIATVRREASSTLQELKEAADLGDDVKGLVQEAQELSTFLKDVRSTATSLLLGQPSTGAKPQSGPGPGRVVNPAPFDVDAT